jgi:hypothetical protein
VSLGSPCSRTYENTPLFTSDSRVSTRLCTSLTSIFAICIVTYPQVYRGNNSGPDQNCVMHVTQGWRAAIPRHAATFGDSSRMSCPRPVLPYRSRTQAPTQSPAFKVLCTPVRRQRDEGHCFQSPLRHQSPGDVFHRLPSLQFVESDVRGRPLRIEDPVVGLYPRGVWPQLNSQWMALACTPILASASDALVVKGPPEELNDESIDVVNLTF